MKLYVIRHAPAEERPDFAKTGQPDEFRPITPKGADRMVEMFRFFKKIEGQMDIVLQSPLIRCLQTGDIMREFFPKAKYLATENLRPDHSAQALYEEILSHPVDSLAIIGHEPDLGQFISWLLFRQATNHFPIKKAGIAKLDLYSDGQCYLKWVLRPKLVLGS